MPPVIGKEKLSRNNLFAYRAIGVFMKQTVSDGGCLFLLCTYQEYKQQSGGEGS